jgi:hypothetical protein
MLSEHEIMVRLTARDVLEEVRNSSNWTRGYFAIKPSKLLDFYL